jgi:hypothetical protein
MHANDDPELLLIDLSDIDDSDPQAAWAGLKAVLRTHALDTPKGLLDLLRRGALHRLRERKPALVSNLQTTPVYAEEDDGGPSDEELMELGLGPEELGWEPEPDGPPPPLDWRRTDDGSGRLGFEARLGRRVLGVWRCPRAPRLPSVAPGWTLSIDRLSVADRRGEPIICATCDAARATVAALVHSPSYRRFFGVTLP